METPFFTIIIPTFNSEKTLSASIETVIAQEYKNWQIWIIDGESIDSTVKIALDYSTKDNRIHFISEKDSGVYDAMNKGLKLVEKDWIYFLGSDDTLYDTEVLTNIRREILKSDCDVLYGNIISEKNGKYGNLATSDTLLINNISHQAMFFKKNVFTKLGLYNLEWKTHADWEFNIRLFEDPTLQTKYVNTTIANYAAGGLSSSHEVKFLQEVLWPKREIFLKSQSYSKFYSIPWFDEWWRFIRNAKLSKVISLETQNSQILPIQIIFKLQNKIPTKFLDLGITSKISMFLAYMRYLSKLIMNKF